VVITCVTADEALRDVVFGAGGVSTTLASDAVLVDSSTVGAPTYTEIASALGSERFVAAPILSNPMVTARGEATLLLGGDAATIERLDAMWELLSAKRWFCGTVEQASACKLVNNLMLIGGVAVLAEAVTVARCGGVSDAWLTEFLDDLPVVSAAVRNRVDRLIRGDHDGWFDVVSTGKDVRLAREAAERGGSSLPLANVLVEQLHILAERGFATSDMTALVELSNRQDG
jgi:3-hydroxyisobutyrate dehydrogenase-like beta-hydroxyacid dehydrogenase